MKIKKIIAWSGTIVLACIIIFTANYLYTYKLERKTSLDKKNRSESLLKKGIYHYKTGKIDSSLTYLFKSMNLQPRSKSSYEASYWIAKNYFNLFGCDSVSLIKKFIDYANNTDDEIVLRESNSLLAKIYAYTFRFPEAKNIHDNNYKRAKLNKDTIGIVENAAKLLRLSVAGSDGYSPYINTEPEDYYFPDITDSCNSRTIPKYLFLCEFLIFSDRFTSSDIDQLSRKDLLEVSRLINPYVKLYNESDSTNYARTCRNIAYFISLRTESFDKDSLALIQLGLQQAKKYYERAIQLYKVQDTYLEKAKCMIEYAEVLEKDSLYDACLSVLNEVNKIKNLTFSIRCDLKYRMAFHATSIDDYALSNKYLEELEIDLYNHVTENLYEKRALNVDEGDALYLKRYNMYKLGQVDAYNKISEELIDSYVMAKELNDKVLDTVYQQTLPKILEARRNNQLENDDQKKTNPKSHLVLSVINIAIIIVVVFIFMLVAFTLFNFYSHYLPNSQLDEYLFLSKSKKVLMKNIIYVHKETGTNYSTFYLKDSTDNLRARVSLVNLFSEDEEEGREALPTNIFLKIHSSYVINMFEVDDLIPNTDSIRMRDGSIIKISRDEKDLLIEKIRAATSNQNKLVLVFREFLKDKSEGFPMAKKYLTKYRQPKALDTDTALHQT